MLTLLGVLLVSRPFLPLFFLPAGAKVASLALELWSDVLLDTLEEAVAERVSWPGVCDGVGTATTGELEGLTLLCCWQHRTSQAIQRALSVSVAGREGELDGSNVMLL